MKTTEIKEQIKTLNNEIIEIYNEGNKQARLARDAYLTPLRNTLQEKTEKIKSLKIELASKKKPEPTFPQEIVEWFKYKYTSGIDYGYGGVKIIYLSPKQKYVIITSKGGTGGTGTAMGRAGYYYDPSHHWIAEVGSVHGAHAKDGEKLIPEIDGRLTKEKKQEFIEIINRLEA